jgi:hypothetical protein
MKLTHGYAIVTFFLEMKPNIFKLSLKIEFTTEKVPHFLMLLKSIYNKKLFLVEQKCILTIALTLVHPDLVFASKKVNLPIIFLLSLLLQHC